MSRRAQRMDFVFDENTGKPTSAKQYEFHSLTENLSLTENFVFATKDAQILEAMERQEKINAKRLHEIESEVSRLSSLLVQSSEDLNGDEQQLFESSHIKAAEIAETFATDEQMAVERIESVVQGQAVRTKHYETQLLSFKQATQQLKQEISVGKSLKDDQEKEALDLAASISSLRIKDASVRRMNELGSEALRVAAAKLEQVKLVEQKREAKLVILRAQRDQVLAKLEKINKERIAILAKVNEIRSGILERRDQHRRVVDTIQEQINSEQRECDSMLRAEKKSLNQLRALDERTLTNEIDQNCAILAELQIAENQNAEAKAAKDADLAQVHNTQLSSAEELRDAEAKLEAIQSELAQVMAEAEDLEAAQAQVLKAAQGEAEDLEKKLTREQKAEVKSSKAALKKIRTRQTKIQQAAAKISQYAPGEEEQTLIDEIIEEDRLAQEMLQKEQEQQEQARIREQAAEQAAEKKKQKAKKAAEAAEARAAEKQRRKEAEAERARAEEEERQQAETEAEAKAAEEEAKAAEAAAAAAKAQAAEEERLRAEALERIQKEKAEIEAARAELEAAKAAKAQAEAEKAQEEEERARAEEERAMLEEQERAAKSTLAEEDKEQYNAADEDEEYDPDQPPRKIMNVAKVRTARKPAAASAPKKQDLKRAAPIKPIKPAVAAKQAAPVPSVRKPIVSHAFSAKEAAPVPRSTFSKVAPVKAAKPTETRKAKTQPAPEYDVPMTSVAADRINKRKLETQTLNASKKTKFDTSQPCDAAKRLAALLDAMPSSQGKSKTTPTKVSPAKVTPPAKKSLAKASSVANKRPDSSSTFLSYMNRIKAL